VRRLVLEPDHLIYDENQWAKQRKEGYAALILPTEGTAHETESIPFRALTPFREYHVVLEERPGTPAIGVPLGIFERHGLPEAIRSDNGAPFASVQALHGLSRLSAAEDGEDETKKNTGDV
jgi:hypothetical protein